MGLAVHGLEPVGFLVDGHGAVAGAAAARTVGLALVVQHHVPQGDALAVALQGTQDNLAEILAELLAETVVRIIPGADGRLREPDALLGGRLVDLVQFRDAPAVVVPGGAGRILGGRRVGVDVQRIAPLGRLVVVVVVVVEQQDLRLEAGLLEGRAHDFQEIALVLPGHIQGHRVAVVQGLVLERDAHHPIPPLLHFLHPLDEIVGIVGVVLRIQAAGSPAVERVSFPLDIHLHPARAAPRGADDLHGGVDPVDLVQDREQELLLALVDGEVRHPLLVAPGVLVHREVRAADADADQRRTGARGGAEEFRQKLRPVFLAHLQEVVAGSLGDGETETVDSLEGLVREADDVRRHRGRLAEGHAGLLEVTGLVEGRRPQGRIVDLCRRFRLRVGVRVRRRHRVLAPAGAGAEGEQADDGV